ncbi:Sugar lactone lactonase YvrE [Cohnella sp. OV330]|uniref:SMP-30/gluconolactonase/LRE family protein n=1 Tax=Cohnella sp. OV330 TaxID=1855288 RepID=UPI0008E5EEC8|nr:SMP-30/gluconolactonase/LRE family protein [Cohnella sp. OV330]SFB29337.1 Sugar lactone lactonase YvrE [Cohnella sp. OV330]
MTDRAELLYDARNTLGEGPWWDSNNGWLHWTDITDKKIHRLEPNAGEHRSVSMMQEVGAFVPARTGGFICAMREGFYRYDPISQAAVPIVELETHLPGNRFNDGKCDAAGRFWAGTMDEKEEGPSGALYCLEADLGCRQVLTDVTISNGLAWSADNRTMYYIDSTTREVVAFDYDLGTGSLSAPRTAVRIGDDEGLPDGMTIDREGMLWIAIWGGGKVVRCNPATGERLQTVFVAASHVTSCAFGGERLDELYITTARQGLSERQLIDEPNAGGVFRYKTATQGYATEPFGG